MNLNSQFLNFRFMNAQFKAILVSSAILLTGMSSLTHASSAQGLSASDKQELKQTFSRVKANEKGPYTNNYCVCGDGKKEPVLRPNGSLSNVCKTTQFCGAFRTPWMSGITDKGMYIGNIYSADVLDWDTFPNHQNLVRGYILEKFFTDTHQEHQLAKLRAYGGLMGAEYEVRDMTIFFERFLNDKEYNDFQHYILAYELQKRYYVRNDQGAITTIRNLASNIRHMDEAFKPLRDATHNQLSASLIPRMAAYRDKLPKSKTKERDAISKLMAGIHKLTSLDQSALAPGLKEIENQKVRKQLSTRLPPKNADNVSVIEALAQLMVEARQAIADGTVKAKDARRLININVTAAAVIQSRGGAVLDNGGPATVKESLRLVKALSNAAYGVGLLSERERKASLDNVDVLLKQKTWQRTAFKKEAKKLSRVIEWAHNSAVAAFAEVWDVWLYLLPDVAHVSDDIVRGSPLLLLGETLRSLGDFVIGDARIKHELFGQSLDIGVRALNPGLTMAKLRVDPKLGDYQRSEMVALPETPAELRPVSGIVTQGEGNVVSHVQLLARALGIPNAVMTPKSFASVEPHYKKEVFFVVTPGGKVYLKEKSAMTADDKAIYAEFSRNAERSGDGALGTAGNKLIVEPDRLDLKTKMPIDLKDMQREDSGVRSGPKAAFLGELKSMFPKNVADGIVVPFGAFYHHKNTAKVILPPKLKGSGIAKAGESLVEFEKKTYHTFFDQMIPSGKDEKSLAQWIQPRLEVIRYSLQNTPISEKLKKAIRDGLDANHLLDPNNKNRTVGCFVRSDTNVEDQDNFNGAGLNLTIFNLSTLDEIYAGLKEVWASPFTYRSFSWRQTVIDKPTWVLPSVVILESVSSEKSGVLVTADIETGEQGKMLIATSEGVGGAVDGTPTETLLWTPEKVELQRIFRSPYRKMLKKGGGSEMLLSTGKDHVLTQKELNALVKAAQHIEKKLSAATGPSGKPRPWDIEFGFSQGKLWLFQVRPFIGNEGMKNIPALSLLDADSKPLTGKISLNDKIR